jgi:hypothetical protein
MLADVKCSGGMSKSAFPPVMHTHFGDRRFWEPTAALPDAGELSVVKWCGVGAVIAAAYQLTHSPDVAYHIEYQALRPRYCSATLIHVNMPEVMLRCSRCSTQLSEQGEFPC